MRNQGCEDTTTNETAVTEEVVAEAPDPAPSENNESTSEATQPETDSATEDSAGEPAAEEKAEPAEEDHHMTEGTEEGAMAIISDVDMLFDYFMGDAERGASRNNNNVDFIMNLVENLAGDEDLMTIRGKDSIGRPFEVINDIREKAAAKAAPKRAENQRLMEKARQTLQEGQEGKDIGGGLMIMGQSDESIEKVQEIEKEIRELQRAENKISREQRADIQATINGIEWANMLITPALVLIIGLLVGITRKNKTAAK